MITIAIIRPFGFNVGNSAINFALRHMLYDVFVLEKKRRVLRSPSSLLSHQNEVFEVQHVT